MLRFRSYTRLIPILSLGAFCLMFVAVPLFAQQQPAAPTITVTVNKSMVFRLAERAKRVSISQPQIADVVVVAPSQLLINGKAVGTTSLIVFDDKGEVSNYDLVVTPDVEALRAQLRVVFPNEKVEVSTANSAIVLKGEVSNEVVYDKVLDIVRSYLPPKPPKAVAPAATTVAVSTQKATLPTSGLGFAGGGQIAFPDQPSLSEVDRWDDKAKIDGIIDLLTIKEVREVELDVIVAEVATQKLREIGFDFKLNTNNVSATFPSAAQSAIQAAAQGIFTYTTRGFSLTTLYRLLHNKDLTEILAQPRLVMKNGRSGGFLAGGEFPVVQTLQNSFSVEFKPFGVRLDFVPTITWSNRIDLRVFPEVSDIDESVAVQGVPGLKVRRAVSRVELNQGESLVIGGLLDRRVLKDLTKFPLLGDIPILGALFRSTRFRNQESELVFVITPRIVGALKPGEKPRLPSIEKYDDPDIRQIPLPESSDERRPPSVGATIP